MNKITYCIVFFLMFFWGVRPSVAVVLDPDSGLMYSVKNWGAVGDGASDDTVAVQNAIDDLTGMTTASGQLVGAVLYFPPGVYKLGKIYLKSDVTLWGGRIMGQGYRVGSARFVPSSSIYDNEYMINGQVGLRNAGLIGFSSYGDYAAHKIGFLKITDSADLVLHSLYIDKYKLEAAIVGGGNSRISYCQFAGLSNHAEFTIRRGSFTLTGADHQISHCEFTGASGKRSVTSANLFAVAALVTCYSTVFDTCVFQMADIGMVITGGSRYRFSACRWDTNSGHGLMLGGGTHFNFDGSCAWSRNSYDSDNSYDHIYVPSVGASCATFTSPMFTNDGHSVRYCINDEKNSATWYNIYLYPHGVSGVTGMVNVVSSRCVTVP